MYNRGSFNEQRFNLLLGQENEVSIREAMVEVIDSIISHGEDIHETSYGIEQFSGSMFAANATKYSESMAEVTNCQVEGYPEHNLVASYSEAVGCNIFLCEDCYDPHEFLEDIGWWIYLSADLHYKVSTSCAFGNACVGSKDYYDVIITPYELLYGTVGSLTFDYKYIHIDVVLPPGGVLIIDSDNYNVLLGEENVIDKQSGSWLDELTRNTFDITIGSGITGELEGKLLFTERYL